MKRVDVQEGDSMQHSPNLFRYVAFYLWLRCKISQHGIQSPPCSGSSRSFHPYLLLLLFMNLVLQINFPGIHWISGKPEIPEELRSNASRFVDFATTCWASSPWCFLPLKRGCQTHFHRGPHQPHGCLRMAKCNFNSLTVKE